MFVILEHVTGEGVHWDLMIERHAGGALATWRLAANPIVNTGTIEATPLGDHRRVYLDYEGAISGGRGEVRRLDRGDATVHMLTTTTVRAGMRGDHMRGEIEIVDGENGYRFVRREV